MTTKTGAHRDHHLRRVKQITSATLVGGMVLTGGFAALAAQVYPGSAKAPGAPQDEGVATAEPDAVAASSNPIAASTDSTAVLRPDSRPRDDHSEDDGPEDDRVDETARTVPAAASPSAAVDRTVTSTSRPTKVVVTTPKRTRTTKPPVSGGS